VRLRIPPLAAGSRAAGGSSTAGTAAEPAPGTGGCALASGRTAGAAACAAGLTIISEVSLGSTAGSAVAPGSETLRPIWARSQLRSAAVSGREARGANATAPERGRSRRSGPAMGFLTLDLHR
jgi:hypothetical protein